MKIGGMLAKFGKSLSFEFYPPKDDAGFNNLSGTLSCLAQHHPSFVSITYGAGGSTHENTARAVTQIQRETNITVMPHLTCIDQDWADLRTLVRSYHSAGIENILALKGDPPPGTEHADRSCRQLQFGADLIRLLAPTGEFSIGMAVYPEGHMASPSLDADMLYTRDKAEAGAEFAITQMFFDNRLYYSFMDRAERWGINIPVIAAIMPIHDINKIRTFCGRCGATMPDWCAERFGDGRLNAEESRKIGVELATAQVADLIANGVRYFHFYTLNKDDMVTCIIRNLGLESYGLG